MSTAGAIASSRRRTGGGGPPAEQVFTANGSFIATSTDADIWGWGAGGGAGARRISQPGGNGAGGSYSFIHLTNLVIGRQYDVTVAPISVGIATGTVGTAIQSAPSKVVDSVTAATIWQAGSGRGGANAGVQGSIGLVGDSIGDTIVVGPAGIVGLSGAGANGGGAGVAPAGTGAGGGANGIAPGGGGATSASGTGGKGGDSARGEVHVQQAA